MPLHSWPRLGKQLALGMAPHLIPPVQAMASRGRTRRSKYCLGQRSNRSQFIPGVHSEQSEEAELPGRQQWLLLQARPSATTGAQGKLTACLPLQGKGWAVTHRQAGATPLPQKVRGVEEHREVQIRWHWSPSTLGKGAQGKRRVTVWEGEGKEENIQTMQEKHPPPLH